MTTHVVYRLYDSSDILLYVGSTNDFDRRLNEHRNRQRWGDSISTWAVDGPHEVGHARWLEHEAIFREKPVFNKRHPANVEVPDEVLSAAINSLPVPEGLRDLLNRPAVAPPVAAQAGKAAGLVRGEAHRPAALSP